MATAYAIPLQKTHNLSFELRTVFYPWHRWYGRTVLTRQASGAHAELAYLCRLPDAPPDVMLIEVPKWMFDAVLCATMRLINEPHVDCVALRILARTIAEQSVSMAPAVVQPQVNRQAGHGDKHELIPTGQSNTPTGAVRRRASCAALEQSHSADAERSSQGSGAATREYSQKHVKVRSSERRAR
jgi:hypothetical protein